MDKQVRKVSVPSFKLIQDEYISSGKHSPPKRPKLMCTTAKPSESSLNADSINRMIRKEISYNLRKTSRTVLPEKSTTQCTKKRQKFSDRRKETSSRSTNIPKLAQKMLRSHCKSKDFDQYMSSSQKRKKLHQPQKLKQKKTFQNSNKKCSINATREVAIQTEPVGNLNEASVEGTEESIDQIDFQQSIDYLRKSIVGHTVKIKEHTFRINECSLSLTKEGSDPGENDIMVIQSDKLISSNLLFLNSLYQTTRTQPQVSEEDTVRINTTSTHSHKPYENKDVTHTDCSTEKLKDIGNIENSSNSKVTDIMKQLSSYLDLRKELRVLLHKLPEDIVEATKNAQNINEKTVEKDGIENEKSSDLSQKLSVEISESSDFKKEVFDPDNHTYSNNNNSEKMDARHSKLFIEILKQIQILKNCNKNYKEKKQNIEGNELNCSVCNPKFKFFDTLMCHKQIKHEDTRTITRCEVCSGVYETSYYNYTHKEKCLQINKEANCPKCSAIMKEKELFEHLLKDHHIVLKKDVYECELCTKKFITYKSLLYHNETIHNIPPIEDLVFKIKCKNCSQLFDFDQYRKKHIRECENKNEGEQNEDNNKLLDTMLQSSIPFQTQPNASSPGEKNEKEDIGKPSRELFSKLEDLFGKNDGPNEITIIDLDK